MDKQTASIALTFMQRVEMKGNEVPAYLQVMQALHALAQPPSVPTERVEAATQG